MIFAVLHEASVPSKSDCVGEPGGRGGVRRTRFYDLIDAAHFEGAVEGFVREWRAHSGMEPTGTGEIVDPERLPGNAVEEKLDEFRCCTAHSSQHAELPASAHRELTARPPQVDTRVTCTPTTRAWRSEPDE